MLVSFKSLFPEMHDLFKNICAILGTHRNHLFTVNLQVKVMFGHLVLQCGKSIHSVNILMNHCLTKRFVFYLSKVLDWDIRVSVAQQLSLASNTRMVYSQFLRIENQRYYFLDTPSMSRQLTLNIRTKVFGVH